MTSKPLTPLPVMKLSENRLFTLVLVMLLPSAVWPVSMIPEPPQFVTSACCTSTCQFRTTIPLVRPWPVQETVSCSIVIGAPVVEPLRT